MSMSDPFTITLPDGLVAVASLDEARDVACDEVAERAPDHQPALDALNSMREWGGTIPLPNGAIVVRRTAWSTLAARAGIMRFGYWDATNDEILYAINGGTSAGAQAA